ncbi:MAG TPA: pentapeptide repeat-containing protein, partial [Spirochaetales bacterium]|nr:pentapeptide repeat-containing protein [Spirochaetales bacterium]
LIHDNFNGIKTKSCTFNHSSFYNSHFVFSEFSNTDFIDCNLKRTFLIEIKEENVNWKFSNVHEAYTEIEHFRL